MWHKLWNIKCRYDPKYAPQYKFKHTNYVKLSTLVCFPLDTHSWHPNHEWPLLWGATDSWPHLNFEGVQLITVELSLL